MLGTLPPGGVGRTSLAVMRGPGHFRRLVVLRPVGDATLVPVATVHPGLLTPLSIDEIDGAVCSVWDFVPGATLREIGDLYRGQSQLPPLGLVVRAVVDAARALHLAHNDDDPLQGPQSFVHGGLADRSLLMGFDGVTRVLDFGVREKNRFSPPEAARGGPFDARSDVFSLAAVLHAALTGFDKSYAQVLARTPSSQEFPPPSTVHPDASQQLDAVVMRALFPAREKRLGSVLELADDLERIVGGALPRAAACGVRLKQLFEERLGQLRDLVPRFEPEPGMAKVPAPRRSRPSGPKASVAPKPAPPPALEPKNITIGAELGGPEEEHPTQIQAVPSTLMMAARPTGEQLRLLGKKTISAGQVPWATAETTNPDRTPGGAPSEPPPGITDEPTNLGMRAMPASVEPEVADELEQAEQLEADGQDQLELEAEGEAEAEAEGGALADYGDIPTSAPRRLTGEQPRLAGHSAEERALARGQELVSTAELEAAEAEEVRRRMEDTGVHRGRGSGQHSRLDDDETIDRPGRKPPKKKGGGGARAFIALLLVLIAGGAAVAKLRPDLIAKVKARLDPQPPPDSEDQPAVLDEDGGEVPVVEEPADAGEGAPASLLPGDGGEHPDAGDDEVDAGDEEDDAGAPSDAGSHKPTGKKKKRRHH